jgi:hypothetical protein
MQLNHGVGIVRLLIKSSKIPDFKSNREPYGDQYSDLWRRRSRVRISLDGSRLPLGRHSLPTAL